ncbi:MAG: hypothetical protein FWD29_10055, partial [Micrococcales bacterium]|nr:hypothetical protein [Micrococcales bacterium]
MRGFSRTALGAVVTSLAVFGLVASAAATPVKTRYVEAASARFDLPAAAGQAQAVTPVMPTCQLRVPAVPANEPLVPATEPAPANEPVTDFLVAKGPVIPSSDLPFSPASKINAVEAATPTNEVASAPEPESPGEAEPTGQAYQKVTEPAAEPAEASPDQQPAPAATALPAGVDTEIDWITLVDGATPALVGAYIQLATAQAALPAAEEAVDAAIAAHAEAQRRHAQLTDSLATARRQLAEMTQLAAAADQTLDESSLALGAMAREAMTKRGTYDPGFAVVLGNDTVDRAIGEHHAREAIGTARRAAISQA